MAGVGIEIFTDKQVISGLQKKFPRSMTNLKQLNKGVIYGEISNRDSLLKICMYLKYKLNFRYPLDVAALDWPEHFELVYHIVSYENNNLIQLHLNLPKDDPEVMSMVRVWKGVNCHEREAFDMMGIIFKTHPDLRRILLPEESPEDYFPLRKEFPLGGEKEGWSSTKPKKC